jgi:hypothetical protein
MSKMVYHLNLEEGYSSKFSNNIKEIRSLLIENSCFYNIIESKVVSLLSKFSIPFKFTLIYPYFVPIGESDSTVEIFRDFFLKLMFLIPINGARILGLKIIIPFLLSNPNGEEELVKIAEFKKLTLIIVSFDL